MNELISLNAIEYCLCWKWCVHKLKSIDPSSLKICKQIPEYVHTYTKDMPINVNDDHSTEYFIFTSQRIHLKCTLFYCKYIII